MRPLSIRTRLAVSYTGVFAVVLLVFAALSYQVTTHHLTQQSDVRLDEVAAGLRGYFEFRQGDPPSLFYDPQDREEFYFVNYAAPYYQLYDAADGRVLRESEASRAQRLALAPEKARERAVTVTADPKMKYTRRSEFETVSRGTARWRFHSAVIKTGTRVYLLRVGILLAPLEATLRETARTFFVVLPVGILVAVLVGWWMARRALKPVDAVTAIARKIGISHLGSRLPLRGTHDELDRLAATFNETFARLEAAVGQMKQFTAGIAHELRTPMSVLQGEAEIALMQAYSVDEYRRVLGSQLTEFTKLNRMFNQLLLLARADAGEVRIASDRIDLAVLTRSLVEQMTLLAEYNKISLRVQGEESLAVIADASWLERVILNLLDNAIKFTPAGGSVTVTVTARDSQAALEVRDTGVGIPAEAMPHVFDRFFRVDAARSRDVPGVGLGLAIVKWAVEAQHGSISVESEEGAGSCFTALLPRPPREVVPSDESSEKTSAGAASR